jgi:two-component system, LytTR family, response regulator
VNRTLRALVADDEPLARARLTRLLEREDGIDVVASCADGAQALQAIRELRPDVVFLDVRMPGMDGFRTLGALAQAERPQVVFVTAYAEHAVRAFDTEATDYLLKPVSGDRLHEAVRRVRRGPLDGGALQGNATPAAAPSPYFARIAVPDQGRLRVIAVEDIDHVLAQRNYVELYVDSRAYTLRETLSHLETRLDPARFTRIHRSRLVRMDAVAGIEALAHGQYVLQLRSGARLRSGRSYRGAVRRAFGLVAEREEE